MTLPSSALKLNRIVDMIIIGLTGGIGSGKSTVAGFLAELDAVVMDADKIGHAVLKTDTEVQRQIVQAFGTDILYLQEISTARSWQLLFSIAANPL